MIGRRLIGGVRKPPFAASGYAALIASDGAIAHWRLGESSGAIQDEIGTNDSTATGGAPTYGVAGALAGDGDTAITFASGDTFTISQSGWPTGAGARSLECWFKSSDASTGDIIGYGSNTGAYNLWYLRVASTGALQLLTRDAAGTGYVVTTFGSTGLRDGEWHHAVITYDGTTARGYIDGVQVGSDTAMTSNMVTSGATYIGVWSGYYVGTADEIAVYPTALSLAQIQSHSAYGA